MTDKSRSGAVYADVLSAPGTNVAELIGGDLYLSARPSVRHAKSATVIGSILEEAVDPGHHPGGWWILNEPELHLDGDVLVPDLAGWRHERLSGMPEERGIALPPDWVCEVLSPSSERFDRQLKMPRYAQARVGHLWLVHPADRRLEVFESKNLQWMLLEKCSGNAVVRSSPFKTVGVDLGALWS